MAIYKVINEANKYHDLQSFQDIIQYVTSADKTETDGVIGGAVLPEIAAVSMEGVVKAFHKENGVKLRHSVLSFSPDEPVLPCHVKRIAKECVQFYEDDYQIIAAVHEDREHLHIHFVMNTTSYQDGHKYHGEKKDYYGFLKHMNQATAPYGVRVYPVKKEL